MKTSLSLFGIILALFSFGCRPSYQDGQFVGSWQVVTNGYTKIYSFSPDHAFVSTFVGVGPNQVSGDWTLDADQLAIVVRSNSFSPTLVSNRITIQILKLTDSALSLKLPNENGKPLARIFHSGIEQRSGESVRRLEITQPNEDATRRLYCNRL
jgi:hypothetical protein